MSKSKPYRRPAYLEANSPVLRRFRKSTCPLCGRLFEALAETSEPCPACKLDAEGKSRVLERTKV
jgi:uncharacterized protein (DUF983 family)